MNIIQRIYSRAYQRALYIAYPLLPYREPELIENKSEGIPLILEKEGKHHPMIVTDKGIVEHGLLKPLFEILDKAGIKYTLFDKVEQNPTTETVESALALFKASSSDSLIALGGGSSMDTAKALGARYAMPRKSLKQMKGILKVYKKLPLLIAIPTTAGTGSEATLAAVIVDSATREKYAISSFPLIPRYAVLDPVYTYSLPKSLTATTGLDALTHAIEAYIGKSNFKLTRMEAKVAVRLIFQNIEKAYENGNDPKARKNMLRASYLAGCAFTRSYVGYVHALSHAMSGKYNTPHGKANAILLPYVLEEYGEAIYKKLKKLAIAINISDELEDEKTAAMKFIDEIKRLNREMNIPEKFEELKKEDIKELSKHAEREANPLYPVPVLWTAKELEKIYNRVLA